MARYRQDQQAIAKKPANMPGNTKRRIDVFRVFPELLLSSALSENYQVSCMHSGSREVVASDTEDHQGASRLLPRFRAIVANNKLVPLLACSKHFVDRNLVACCQESMQFSGHARLLGARQLV
jgi:hypothetical protein